ncbi:hypothetical protein K435DRAFT_398635 [Dendrothele bispora CBS 962.96]|uniref:Uncharacterized protein n=1 Tax=Dendrothele bispora (strain CBS 962.96) TaxID=1314807 RepID=A0A4V4HCU6_DENBC|nr:hypothetical protein K435DRAFT_398635 [Dendrothele bispora CBS 962.96]
MTQRRLDLHASALNDAEYELYTTSLADITLADEETNNNDVKDKDKEEIEHDDAYYDRLTVSVREARAWLRGRYSHVTAVTIDNILKFFSPTLSQTDVLTGGQFFAALRLVVHAESGKEVDRTFAFVQAHPTKTSTSRPASPPAKRPIPPAPVSRKSLDGTHNNPFAAATSTPSSQQSQPPPPQHPSSTNNPFAYTTRSKSTPAAPKSHDGTLDSSPSKLPPLPPRKPPPPIPPSSSAPLQPPPRHNSLVPSNSSLLTSKTAPLPGTSSAVSSPFGSPFGNSNGTPPPLPPKTGLGHVAHVTSTLMKQSLQASKTGSAMKKAEEQLEKERVLSVLKSSASNSRSSPFSSTTSHNHSSTSISSVVPHPRNRSVSPNKWEGSSTSSYTSGEDVEKREPPPLPSRKKKPSPPQTVSAISTSSFQSVALAQASAHGGIEMTKRMPSSRSKSNPFDVYRSTSRPTSRPTSRSPSVSPTRDGRQRELPSTPSGPPPRHPDQGGNFTSSAYTQRKPPPPIPAGFLPPGSSSPTSTTTTTSNSHSSSMSTSATSSGIVPTSPFGGNSGLSTPFSSPSMTMSGAKSASPYVSTFNETGGRTPTRPSGLDLSSPFGDPGSSGPGSSSPSASAFSVNSSVLPSPKDDSPTTRLFRSKSLHHPTSAAGSSYLKEKSPFFDENDREKDESAEWEGFQTRDTTPTHSPTQIPPRRKRPESMQVLGVGWGGSPSVTGSGGAAGGGGGRHMSLVSTPSPPTTSVIPLRQQLMHRRMTSNGSASVSPLMQDDSSTVTRVMGTGTATGGLGSSPFKTIATSLGPQLEALQPKLDKARYKAEAGLSKRGFVRDGLHGLNGMSGERDERERRKEERTGLMNDKERWEQSVDSDSGSDGEYGYDDDEERFRIRGLRRGPSSHSQSSSFSSQSKSRTKKYDRTEVWIG